MFKNRAVDREPDSKPIYLWPVPFGGLGTQLWIALCDGCMRHGFQQRQIVDGVAVIPCFKLFPVERLFGAPGQEPSDFSFAHVQHFCTLAVAMISLLKIHTVKFLIKIKQVFRWQYPNLSESKTRHEPLAAFQQDQWHQCNLRERFQFQ